MYALECGCWSRSSNMSSTRLTSISLRGRNLYEPGVVCITSSDHPTVLRLRHSAISRVPNPVARPRAGDSERLVGIHAHSRLSKETHLRQVSRTLSNNLGHGLVHPLRREQLLQFIGSSSNLCIVLVALDKELKVFLEDRNSWMKLKTTSTKPGMATHISSPALHVRIGRGWHAGPAASRGCLNLFCAG